MAQCVDEVTMNKYNYGMVTFEPVYDQCEYSTSRQTNEDLVLTSFTKFQAIQCFSYAQFTIADFIFANYNDLYIQATQLDFNRVYVQMQIQDRQGGVAITST